METYVKKMNRIKYLIFIVIVLAIFSLLWLVSRSFATIKISPASAKLTIDNAPVYVNRSGVARITIKPGTHLIKVESEGYLSLSEELNFGRGSKVTYSLTLKEKPKISTIEQNAQFLATGKNSDEILYLDPTGKTIFKAKLSLGDEQKIITAKLPITSDRLSGIRDIIWSPNRDLALFKKDDGYYLFDFQKYDFVHQTETFWGKDIGDVAWSPDNSKIAYYYAPATGERSLIFANITNSEITRIINFNDYKIENPFLSWSPDSEYLIIIPRGTNYSENKIYLYDTYSGTLKAITDLGSQINAKFSPDSNQILYATYNKISDEFDPFVLSIMNKDGTNQKNLNIKTDVKSSAWLNSTTLLAAQYNRSGSNETFYRYDLGQKEPAEAIESVASKLVNSISVILDGSVVIYQSSDGIFGFRLK